ncbi:DUF1090 domain-containing protein [Hydrogenophaga sp.]|uniref:DUF1090 domain-containing protein n=1 Tax=Hydrogenophaga sp. TaxID=1904254 RepID=UPI0027276194|nr:DUF1090 domain-containing protein [Hydrogenophaga sp.]MDO9437556.1 DUF1090 domain-containing protein [Hydrogenophaga sp.]
MKRFLSLAAAAALCTQLAFAANEPTTAAAPLKGCAAKVASIENELIIAKSKGQTRKVKGLEEALGAAQKCDDQSLLAEREKKVRDATDKVGERDKELKEEVREGKKKDITKARKKLAEAQKELTAAKAELQR